MTLFKEARERLANVQRQVDEVATYGHSNIRMDANELRMTIADLEAALKVIDEMERALNYIANDSSSWGLEAEPYAERAREALAKARELGGEK